LLDAFLLILAPNFDILYVSEAISQHLGLSQVELCGNSLWAYVHPDDAPFIRAKILNNTGDLSVSLRMRSTLTKRRNRESPNCIVGYKVVNMEINANPCALLAFCQPHSVRVSNGTRISSESFVVTTDDALTIVYVDSQ
jgi:PAS domain-containing protein